MKKAVCLILVLSLAWIVGCEEGQLDDAVSTVDTTSEVHPFSVYDMLAMDRVSGPAASPDGQWVAFTVSKTDIEADKGRTNIWAVDINGVDEPKQLTSDPASDNSPCWSPDGKYIYFLSSRSGSSQLWRMKPTGADKKQLTDLPLGISNLIISPDGQKVAFTAEVFVGKSIEQTKEMLDEKEKQKSSGKVYESVFIRHWDTWEDGRRSHLFVMGLDDKDVVDVMNDMDADTPSMPFGGSDEFVFTPDSAGVVFSARDVGKEEAWSTDFDLYYASAESDNWPICLTDENQAWDTSPTFSPDGRTMAYLAMKRPGYESDKFDIVLYDWAKVEKKVLTAKWDRSPSSIAFSPDGQSIYATAGNIGQKSLFRIDVQTARATVIIKKGYVSSPAVLPDRIVFTLNNLKSPNEIYSIGHDGRGIKMITKFNAKKLAYAKMGDYEQFTFKGYNDEDVYCYIVKPINFDASKKYPVAFLIHGGPQGSFGNMFHYRWNPQVYSGAGYVAVMVDFHGSTGYGQEFCDSIRGDWGGKPLEDLQKGLAAAIDRYKWIDADRVSALGASFGGYMINWIEGNWPDRFRCLINHDGNICERMAYYDTEELWFPEWDHLGTPWENPQGYEKHNPINHVGKWKTPMLVIHGGLDYRVVDTQGLATFNALQRRGIDSKLLYFPDENHWVLKPSNSILWHKTVIDWLNQWTK